MLDAVTSGVFGLLAALNYHHPIHPTQVHMPVGLIAGAFFLGVLGQVRHQPLFNRSAWHCMNLALVFMLPTIATGLLDWRHSYAGAMLPLIQAKFILATILSILLCAGFFIGRRGAWEGKRMVPIYTLCFLTAVGLGFIGGELVFGSGPQAAANDYKAGQELFAANCSSCHPNGGNRIKPDTPLKNSAKTSNFQTFNAWIRNPIRPMPPFPETDLSDAEAKELYQYVVNVINKS